mgnify:CR=1 FL=1
MNRVSALLIAGLAAACAEGSPAPAPANRAPAAAAGPDLTADEGATIAISGAASVDPDGALTAFEWVQTGGSPVVLRNATGATAVFDAPLVAADATLRFRLTVTDNDGATASDEIDVTVRRAAPGEIVEARMTYAGEERAYLVYTPASYAPGGPAVLLLHGGGRSMRLVLNAESTTQRWLTLADSEGFLLVAPNGFNEALGDGLGDAQSWNDLRDDDTGRTSNEDDVGFVMAALDAVRAARGHDPDRVFATGASNGGMMSMRLLIERGADFAGAAAFIAALPQETVQDPLAPKPIMLLNGDQDAAVLFGGGPVADGGAPTRSVPDTVDYFTRVTGADVTGAVTRLLPDAAPDDKCRIIETSYPSTTGGAPPVVFYLAQGGGHNIPDPMAAPLPPAAGTVLGNRCRDAHGVDLAYDFFTRLLN